MDEEITTQKPGEDFITGLDDVANSSTEHVSGKALYASASLGSDKDKDFEKIADVGEDIEDEDNNAAAAEQNEEDQVDEEVDDAAKNSEVKTNCPRCEQGDNNRYRRA